MPAKSEAQRKLLNAKFGHEWVKAHHFDNKGKLPAKVKKPAKKKGKVAVAAAKKKPAKKSKPKPGGKKCSGCGKPMSKCSCKGY